MGRIGQKPPLPIVFLLTIRLRKASMLGSSGKDQHVNPNEIYELQLQLVEIINGLWEIWLGLTFAFIVAFHLGRKVIGLGVTYVSCFLFVGASILVALRYIDYGMMIVSFNTQLLDGGYAPLPQAPWTTYGIYNALTLLLISVGTGSATLFAIKGSKHSAATSESSD
jgi:hypothetical protein